MSILKAKDLSHWFGEKRVLHNINLEIGAGQIVALVGPSGSGKSTLLRAILGTHPPRQGQVLVNNLSVEQPTRDVGIVYQHYSLYEFLTAEQNVAFGLMLDQTSMLDRIFGYSRWRRTRKQHLEEARALLDRVGLAASATQFPSELSGGMRQRVAIAQALIMRPKLILLDEPFGALDESTREDLQLMLLRLYDDNIQARRRQEEPPYTILIVTHELNEALYVSDRVIGLSQYHAEGTQGATIVYDKAAPVFRPDEPKDVSQFFQQKEELLRAVFDEDHVQHHSEFISFWESHDKAYEAL